MTIGAPGGVLSGLASALSFGIGDFAGGLASRRSSGLAVAAVAQLVGTLSLAGLVAFLRPGLPDAGSLAIGAAAGLSGAVPAKSPMECHDRAEYLPRCGPSPPDSLS